jgi:hypothetical protein
MTDHQLSLVDELPELSKQIFLDVFVESSYDVNRGKWFLLTLANQYLPAKARVGCPQKYFSRFPVGTIFKMDLRLIRRPRRKPYFLAIRRNQMSRAIEFYDFNRKLESSSVLK